MNFAEPRHPKFYKLIRSPTYKIFKNIKSIAKEEKFGPMPLSLTRSWHKEIQ